ncbi:Metallo-dependent phosphatase [Hymenopellis radicata]|nr:Metallo-dependent phosphatase [Hymenopellis radicata]
MALFGEHVLSFLRLHAPHPTHPSMGLKERRTSRTTARRPLVVNGLRIFWAVVVVWGELVVYFWSASSCSWPDGQLPATGNPPTHVMLLSDPQVKPPNAIRDDTWLSSLGEIVFDVSVKKSWRVAKRFKPDVVVFLGDMLSGGKYVRSENEYNQYFQKFQDTFPMSNNVSVHYMPGNNDVGMGVSHALSKKVRTNYFSAFGPFNYQAIIRDHRFIFLDAPGLVDEDYQRSATGNSYDQWSPVPQGPVEFVQKMSLEDDTKPVVLLTHIPLARPDTGSCGPLREKGTIRRGVGHGYQNTFGKQTTSFLLKTLHPTIVFSGDNRDYCDYTHKASPNDLDSTNDIREVTIKSFLYGAEYCLSWLPTAVPHGSLDHGAPQVIRGQTVLSSESARHSRKLLHTSDDCNACGSLLRQLH